MDSSLTARRVLARAAVQAGSVAALAGRLKVAERLLAAYITGTRPVPEALFLAALDIMLEHLPEARVAPRAEALLRNGTL